MPSRMNCEFSVCKPKVLPHNRRGISSLQLNLEEMDRRMSIQSLVKKKSVLIVKKSVPLREAAHFTLPGRMSSDLPTS